MRASSQLKFTLINFILFSFSLGFLGFSLVFSQAGFALEKTKVIPEVNSRVKKFVKNKKDIRVQTTHINNQEIKNSPVTNLSELLQQEQSIVRLTNNSVDNNQTALSIRGFGANASANSLILIDGFPLTNASLLAPNFNAISLSDIERVDITQGSQGTLYGDQAVGGVVSIITRHPEKFLGNLSAGFGSYNQQFYNALVGSKFGNGFFFKVFGMSNKTNNFREHNNQNNETVLAQAGFDYARGTINFNIQSSENTTLFPGELSQTQFKNNPRQASNFKNFGHYKTQIFQILNKHTLLNNWILETRLSQQLISGDGEITIPFNQNERVSMINPRMIGFVKGNKIIFGYFWENNYYHISHSLYTKQVRAKQNNVYAQIVFPLTSSLDLTLGGRLAWQNNQTENVINQTIFSSHKVFVTEQGLAFHPTNEWQLFIRRDGNFRFAKANETTWTPVNAKILQPQTGVSYEAGATRETQKQKTQLSIYRLQLNNEIAFDTTRTIFQPMGSYRNFSHTLRDGVTLTETYKLTSQILFNTQLNYVNARFASGIFSGNTMPAVPAFNANAGVVYQFLENWRAKYSGLYTGSSFASADDANIGKKQSGYWLHTFALQYIGKSFDVNIEVANLFDAKYCNYVAFKSFTHSYLYFPGAGRSVLLTFKASID